MTDTQREALHAKFRELGYTTNSQTTELLDVVFEALTQHQTQAQQAKCSHVWHAGLMTSGGYEAVCAKCGLRPEAAQFQAQQAEIDYVPGTWFKSQSVDQTQAFYLSRLPAIREAAREHGYAIGVHGSTRRDFDLIAMQWREGASDKDTLAHAIAMAACGIDRQGAYEWEEKGAGRVACSIPICWTPHPSEVGAGHIDLSLIKAQQAAAVPAGWKLVPIEPTPEMLTAAAQASMQHLIDCINDPKKAKEVGSEEMCKRTHASRYRSMIAAAPAAPQVSASSYSVSSTGSGPVVEQPPLPNHFNPLAHEQTK